MSEVSPIVFTLLSVLVLVPAILVVVSDNLFHAGIALITCFMGVAGVYVTLSAPFVAGMQVLVYAGAIAVILLFAFMLTHDLMHPLAGSTAFQKIPAAILCTAIAGGLMMLMAGSKWAYLPGGDLAKATSIPQLGQEFLTRYVVPFELVSLLLLITLVGAVTIARKEEAPPPS